LDGGKEDCVATPLTFKRWIALCCCISLLVAWTLIYGIEASEFGGGRITGTLLTMAEIGVFFFVLALLLTWRYSGLAAVNASFASLCTLPIYLYLVFPGLIQKLLGGEYSVPVHAVVTWNTWATVGLLTLSATVLACIRFFSSTSAPTIFVRG
jgi:hypothetical protein